MRESAILRDIMRSCTRCGEVKPLDAFAKGRSTHGTHYYCRACMSGYQKELYRQNRDQEIARSAKWNKENASAVAAARRRQRAARREHFREYQKKWRAGNRDSSRALDANKRAKRRAKKAGSVGVTAKQWRDIKEKCGHRCVYCGQRTILTMDHVIPLSKGGLHEPANILPACRACNSRKGATDPIEHANRIGKLL